MANITFQSKLNHTLSESKAMTALAYGDRHITYDRFNNKAKQIAGWIRESVREDETFIGILMQDRLEYIAAIIGILKSGHGFVPLDPANPPDRLAQMIDILNLNLVFIDDGFVDFSIEYLTKERIINFANIKDLPGNVDASNINEELIVEYTPEDKVYVYFTSGTTGKPKAIVGKGKSLLHYCEWEIEQFEVDGNLRLSQFATTSDAFLKEIFVTFLAGGTLCIPEDLKEILYPEALIDWIEKVRVNMVHCVPHVFRIFSSGTLSPESFLNLKYVVLSGEVVYPEDLKGWYEKIGDRIQLVNLYGTTETTILNTCYYIKSSDVNRERIPIGKPIKGNRVIILDENMKICPKNAAGEIYIRTPYRTFGYYEDEEFNRQKFIKNPFSEEENDLIFKTGDSGRLLPDGNIEYLGRIDRQVKIRGHRIELSEIETILINHPLVKEAVLMKKELADNIELLIAYIVEEKKDQEELSLHNIKEYLSGKLPEYMVPARIVKIKEIPRKPNRKIDYHQLDDYFAEESLDFIPPRDEVEKRMTDIWCEILKTEKIGVKDDFFKLGGSSLNMMLVTSRIYKEFDVRVTLGEVFNNPTIEKQAELIKKAAKSKFISIEPVEEKEYYPLSSAQKRLYIINQVESRSTNYNIPSVYQMEGVIDRIKLKGLFEKLVKRHESLRTSFHLVGSQVVQRPHKKVELDIEYFEVDVLAGTAGKEEFAAGPGKADPEVEMIVRNFIRPFNLSQAPLLRVGMINLRKKKGLLMVDIHHIVSDFVSNEKLIRDFFNVYKGQELPALRLRYIDYSAWQNDSSAIGEIGRQERYWLEKFSGEVPVLEMPLDYARPPVQDFSGECLRFRVDGGVYIEIRKLLQETGTTLYMFLLTICNILLWKYTNQEDIIIGSPVMGRTHRDLEEIIGMFVGQLPMRNFPAGHKSFRDFLDEVRFNTLQAFNNQEYPFEELTAKLGLQGNPGRHPLFDVVFASFDRRLEEDNELKLSDLKFKFFSYEPGTSKTDLRFGATGCNQWMDLDLTYSPKLFKRSTCERMAERFMEILTQVLNDVDIKLADIMVSHRFSLAESFVEHDLESDFGF